MRKWWWWWLPGWRKKWKLEKRRARALSFIEGERLAVEQMVQRPRRSNDDLNEKLLDQVRRRLAEIQNAAKEATRKRDLDDLMDDAEEQGQFRGYLCPCEEIQVEGCLAIALLKEWSVPQAVVAELHELLDQPLKGADPEAARSALRSIFEEVDSWRDYTFDYEDKMDRYAKRLFWLTVGSIVLGLVAFHFSLTVLVGLLFSGFAGSFVSVMTKLPVRSSGRTGPGQEVGVSGELDAYARRIFIRIAVGVIASLIGCGLLGWGFVSFSIHDQTFADVLNGCSTPCSTYLLTSCSALRTLILLAVPMIFGFSERALASFEQQVFGKQAESQKG